VREELHSRDLEEQKITPNPDQTHSAMNEKGKKKSEVRISGTLEKSERMPSPPG